MRATTRPCPSCSSQVELLHMASGWFGRYDRCPHCRKPLVLVFQSAWIEAVYSTLYPGTAIYAWMAADSLIYHFARPGDIAQHAFLMIMGMIAAMLPGLRLATMLAMRSGELAIGSLSDLNPWKRRSHEP